MSKHRKIKKTYKGINEFNTLKISLMRNIDSREALSKFKKRANIKTIEKYFGNILKYQECEHLIIGKPFPKRWSELCSTPILDVTDLKKELIWLLKVCNIYTDEINNFLISKNKFEISILHSEYENAAAILEEIKCSYGYSVWYLENKLALLQQSEGLEQQKYYSRNISEDKKIDSLIKYLAYYISIRAERTVSSHKYDALINDAINVNENNPYISNYLAYRLHFFYKISKISDYNFIIGIEQNFPIIDRYLTCINICNCIIAGYSNKENLATLQEVIRYLPEGLSDFRLENIKYFTGYTDNIQGTNTDRIFFSYYDKYIEGKYEEVISYCEQLNWNKNQTISIYELYLKSSISANTEKSISTQQGLSELILNCMRNVLEKNDKAHESVQDISKIIITYPSHDWTAQLIGFVVREFLYDSNSHRNMLVLYGCMCSNYLNPRFYRYLSSDISVKYLTNIYENYGTFNFIEIFFSYVEKNITKIEKQFPKFICKEEYLRFKALIFLDLKHYDLSLKNYFELYNTSKLLYKQDALMGIIRSYIENKQINECMRFTIKNIIDNINLRSIIPVKEILDIVESSNAHILKNELYLSLLYNIYSTYIAKDKDVFRYEAYEDFLLNNGVKKPSEFNYSSLHDQEKETIYYLRYICTPQVMDSSIYFDSSEDIDTERIKICQILCKIDPLNSDIYTDEIKELTQVLIINKGIREVENSKIYVDVDGIKRDIYTEMSESFKRYVSLPRSKTNSNENPEYYSFLSRLAFLSQDRIEFTIPNDEKFHLFKNIFVHIRDKFLSSNDYGLDAYLSVGIRHGTLSGQLRSPIELERLITQKDTRNDKYRENEYWLERFSEMNNEMIQGLQDHFANFSRDIDKLISTLKNDWIQIRTEKKKMNGFFDYTVSDVELKMLEMNLNNKINYDEFIDVIFNILWEMTEINLEKIRKAIKEHLKDNFDNVFYKFIKELRKYKADSSIYELENSLNRARISMQYELDKIASWFKRSEANQVNDYYINFPIDIAAEMINNTIPRKIVRPRIDSNLCKMLRGDSLKSLVNIFYIIFNNISTHCKLENKIIDVDVEIYSSTDCIEFMISNRDEHHIDIETKNRELDSKKMLLLEGGHQDAVKIEGGSGFPKIVKIINIDLHSKHKIDYFFSFIDECEFNLNINIEKGRLLA